MSETDHLDSLFKEQIKLGMWSKAQHMSVILLKSLKDIIFHIWGLYFQFYYEYYQE